MTVYVAYSTELMGFGINRPIVGRFDTQAKANAFAAARSNVSAYASGVADSTEVYQFINPNTGAITVKAPNEAPHELITEAWKNHSTRLALLNIARGQFEGGGHFVNEFTVLNDFLLDVAEFSYLVFHTEELTIAQKIAWAKEVRRGPANLRVTKTGNAGLIDVIRRFYTLASGGLVAPHRPYSWCNPETAVAVNLGVAVPVPTLPDGTRNIPSSVKFDIGDWIPKIPIALSNNADLSALAVSGYPLTPVFATETTTYSISAPQGTAIPLSDITYTKSDQRSSVVVNVLNTHIEVDVTSESGTAHRAYRIQLAGS